jgi:Cys-Gly metallodipeptidase DUG1
VVIPCSSVLSIELGMEESGSEGLDELIQKEAKIFFKDVDCVCISDNYWLNDRTVSRMIHLV